MGYRSLLRDNHSHLRQLEVTLGDHQDGDTVAWRDGIEAVMLILWGPDLGVQRNLDLDIPFLGPYFEDISVHHDYFSKYPTRLPAFL